MQIIYLFILLSGFIPNKAMAQCCSGSGQSSNLSKTLTISPKQGAPISVSGSISTCCDYGGRIIKRRDKIYKIFSNGPGTGFYFAQFNASNSSAPYSETQWSYQNFHAGIPIDFAMDDEDYVYMLFQNAASTDTLQVYKLNVSTDYTNSMLTYVGGGSLSFPTDFQAGLLTQSGNYLAAANFAPLVASSDSIRIISKVNRSSPTFVGGSNINFPGMPYTQVNDLIFYGQYLMVSLETGGQYAYWALDWSAPSTPTIVNINGLAGQNEPRPWACADNICYTVTWFQTVYAIDWTDHSNPIIIGALPVTNAGTSIALAGHVLVVGMDGSSNGHTPVTLGDSIALIDITDPKNMYRIDSGIGIADKMVSIITDGQNVYASGYHVGTSISIFQIPSVNSPMAELGSVRATSVHINNNLQVDQEATFGQGITVRYGGIRSEGPIVGPIGCAPETKAQILASTPTFFGQCQSCLDCTSETVCYGTSTVNASQWSGSSSRANPCR